MSGQGEMMFPMPMDFISIKAEIKDEYAGYAFKQTKKLYYE